MRRRAVWHILYVRVIMKKLLILFGLNNLAIGLLLVWPLLSGEELFDFTLHNIFLCSIIALFTITAIGLPLRNQFAWSANFILGVIAIINVSYILFLLVYGAFTLSSYPDQILSLRLLGFLVVIGVALFSIIRTLRQDIMQLLRITIVQKRLTVVAGLLILVFLGWHLVRLTSMFKIFEVQ